VALVGDLVNIDPDAQIVRHAGEHRGALLYGAPMPFSFPDGGAK
jgi:hypothetical protein